MYQALISGSLIFCVTQFFIASAPDAVAKANLYNSLLQSIESKEKNLAPNSARHDIIKVADESNTAEVLFDEAQYDFDAGDHSIAKRRFTSIIEKYPGSQPAVKAQKYLEIIDKNTPSAASNKIDNKNIRSEPDLAPDLSSQSTLDAPMRDVSLLEPDRPNNLPNNPQEKKEEFVPDPVRQRAFLMAVGDRIFFSSGSAVLDNRAQIALQRQAQWLSGNLLSKGVDIRIHLIGHAFEESSITEDEKLSRQRATAVRDWLVSQGISAELIEIVAVGRTSLITECKEAACLAQNNRVIIQILAPERSKAVSRPLENKRK